MCGIIGTISLNGDPSVPLDRVRAGMDRMALRGPDDHGLFSAPGIALGHRRLSIIDLDARSSDLALQKLAQVPGTLRCRVLF